jgi:4-hydroxyproline epimerase
VKIDVEGHGAVSGDVAWGGNWFFLVSDHGQEISLARAEQLTEFTWKIREALVRNKITGNDGKEIDHVELFGPCENGKADSRNFVLCPGKAYDRSPCGTGTSAKLACLFADGRLKEGQIWRQESIVGSVFAGSIAVVNGQLYPKITGSAHVNAEAALILDPNDPFCFGFPR